MRFIKFLENAHIPFLFIMQIICVAALLAIITSFTLPLLARA
jgi:hypothetical protein